MRQTMSPIGIRIGLFVSSLYLILTALISFAFLISMLLDGLVKNITSGLALFAMSSVILLTLWVNGRILAIRKLPNRKTLVVNLIICSAQSISFFSDSFRYKFTMGFEWIGFFHYERASRVLDYGTFFTDFIFDFILDSKPVNGMTIGINFIAIFLFVCYFLLLRHNRRTSLMVSVEP